MTFIVKTRGAPRPIVSEFRCPMHGKFSKLVDSGADFACCPIRDDCGEICNEPSPWTPSLVPMRMRRVEATKGKDETPLHPDWNATRNLEEGQDFDDWEADREVAAEERRKQIVMDAIRSER